jgi:hypothetical protein
MHRGRIHIFPRSGWILPYRHYLLRHVQQRRLGDVSPWDCSRLPETHHQLCVNVAVDTPVHLTTYRKR